MERLTRRYFLKMGTAATVGMGSARLSTGLAAWHRFPAATGTPTPPTPSPEDQVQPGNLVANGDFKQGSIGSVPEGWSVVARNSALKPLFKLVSGQGGGQELMAEGNGREQCYGYIRCPVRLLGGKTYRMRVKFRFSGAPPMAGLS